MLEYLHTSTGGIPAHSAFDLRNLITGCITFLWLPFIFIHLVHVFFSPNVEVIKSRCENFHLSLVFNELNVDLMDPGCSYHISLHLLHQNPGWSWMNNKPLRSVTQSIFTITILKLINFLLTAYSELG